MGTTMHIGEEHRFVQQFRLKYCVHAIVFHNIIVLGVESGPSDQYHEIKTLQLFYIIQDF